MDFTFEGEELFSNNELRIQKYRSMDAYIISDVNTAESFETLINAEALESIYRDYIVTFGNTYPEDDVDNRKIRYVFIDGDTGMTFNSEFSEDPLEASHSLIIRIIQSIQDSKIYIRQGWLTVDIAHTTDNYEAFGSSNKLIRGLNEYIIISHKTVKNCIYSSCYHFKLLCESDFKKNIFTDPRISAKSIDFLKCLTGMKTGYKDILSYDYTIALPLIQLYFAEKLRKNKLMNCRMTVMDGQFNSIFELPYLESLDHLPRRHLELRIEKKHAELIINRKFMQSNPDRLLVMKELELHFQGVLKVYRDLGVNGRIMKCVAQKPHFIWEKPNGKTMEYQKIAQLEFDLLKKGVMFMEKEFDNYREIILKVSLEEKIQSSKKKPTKPIIKNIVAFDIETTRDLELKHEIAFMIGMSWRDYDLKKDLYKQFTGTNCINEFFKYISDNKIRFNNCVFYGHNSGKFDNFILLKEYLLKEDSLFKLTSKKFIVINKSLISFDLFGNTPGFKISFKDSYRMMPDSLAKLTKSFKVATPKQDIDIGKLRLEWQKHEALISEYLRHDCQGLLEVLIDFRKTLLDTSGEDIVNHLTAPSCAISIFLKNFYTPEKWPLFDLPCMLDRILRSSYHGGRVECNYLGCFDATLDSPIFMDDINSLYPTVMREYLPYGKPKFVRHTKLQRNGMFVDDDNNLKPETYGFMWCRVLTVKDMGDMPRLHAYHDGMRLLFPDFDEDTDLIIFTEEIKLSQKHTLGYEYKYLGLMQFERAKWMQDFIDTYYEKKRLAGVEKNAAKKLIFKLFLNSVYGNFGIKKERSCLTIFSDAEVADYMKIWDRGKVFNLSRVNEYTLVEFEDIIEAKACSIYVANAITALARMTQWSFQKQLVDLGHKVLFGDTDSTCYQFNPKSNIRDFIKSDFYLENIVGGVEGTIGKSKDEMLDYVEHVPREELSNYLEPYQLTLQDNMIPATRVYIAGCKMYFLEAKIGDKIYNKVALKGFRKKNDSKMDEDRFKELFLVNGLISDQVQFRNEIMEQQEPFNIKIQDIQKTFYSNYMKGDISIINDQPLEECSLKKLQDLMAFEAPEDQQIFYETDQDSELNNKRKRIDEDYFVYKKPKITLEYNYKIAPYKISKIPTKRLFPKEYLEYYFN